LGVAAEYGRTDRCHNDVNKQGCNSQPYPRGACRYCIVLNTYFNVNMLASPVHTVIVALRNAGIRDMNYYWKKQMERNKILKTVWINLYKKIAEILQIFEKSGMIFTK